MTSISKSEMNIRIPLCSVRNLNGILKIGNLSEKDALTEKKKIKHLGNNCDFRNTKCCNVSKNS